MIPKKVFTDLVDSHVYIYVKNVSKEFAGKVLSITDDDLVILEDKNNNLSHIPISVVTVITERR